MEPSRQIAMFGLFLVSGATISLIFLNIYSLQFMVLFCVGFLYILAPWLLISTDSPMPFGYWILKGQTNCSKMTTFELEYYINWLKYQKQKKTSQPDIFKLIQNSHIGHSEEEIESALGTARDEYRNRKQNNLIA